MNKPSIHISVDCLANILKDNNVKDSATLAIKIAQETYNNNLSIRSELKVRVSTKRKANRIITLAKTDDLTDLFNVTLVNNRNKTHARNVDIIKKTSGEYPALQECALLAKGFCDTFNIKDLKIGFQLYIDISLSLMKIFALHRFKYLNEKIHFNYAVQRLIDEDPNKSQLLECITSYREWVNKNLDFKPTVSKAEDMITFMDLRDISLSNGLSFDDFFEAQEDRNGIIDLKWIIYDTNASLFRAKKKFGINKKEKIEYLKQKSSCKGYYDLLEKANILRKKKNK